MVTKVVCLVDKVLLGKIPFHISCVSITGDASETYHRVALTRSVLVAMSEPQCSVNINVIQILMARKYPYTSATNYVFLIRL